MGSRLATTAFAALALAACHPVPFGPLMGSELGDGSRARCQLARDAWLEPVTVEDASATDREPLERSLTLELQRFLREERAFRQVSLLPGKPEPDDLVLRFEFPRFEQTVIQCPRCTFWTAALMGMSSNNMESWDLHSELTGRLRIQRVTGEELTTAHLELTEDASTERSPWTRSPGAPSTIEVRARLVRRLVDDACRTFPIGSAE